MNCIFTFGIGDSIRDSDGVLRATYTVIAAPTWEECRTEMVRLYGTRWAFQYASAEEAGVETYNLLEVTR